MKKYFLFLLFLMLQNCKHPTYISYPLNIRNPPKWWNDCEQGKAIGTFFYIEELGVGSDKYEFYVDSIRFTGDIMRRISGATLGSKYTVVYCKINPAINVVLTWDRVIEPIEFDRKTEGDIFSVEIDHYLGTKVINGIYQYKPHESEKYLNSHYSVEYSEQLHIELLGDLKQKSRRGLKKINKKFEVNYSKSDFRKSYLNFHKPIQ